MSFSHRLVDIYIYIHLTGPAIFLQTKITFPRIGSRENLQETHFIFHGKIHGSCRVSIFPTEPSEPINSFTKSILRWFDTPFFMVQSVEIHMIHSTAPVQLVIKP